MTDVAKGQIIGGAPITVWCVVCVDQDDNETTHIFSTQEKAQAFCDVDIERGHVVYDYVIDHPERMEGLSQ